MGGPTKADKQAERDRANKQDDIADKSYEQSQEDRTRRNALQAPQISQLLRFASGTKEDVMNYAAPQLAEITAANEAQRKAIMESLPPGPVRDAALAQVARDKPAQTANLFNKVSTTMSDTALDKLTNIGQGLGSFSLQELGASSRFGEASSATRNNVMQADAAGKQATMGFLGGLAGAGGAVAGAKLG